MDKSAKILLLGQTRVGKSAVINYFLGKEVARSQAGAPVTQHLEAYRLEEDDENTLGYPVEIFDTKGIEAKNAYLQLDDIIAQIKERYNSDSIFNWFHTIFYCVSMTKGFQEYEGKFIRRLQSEVSQHIHIILTHCDAVAPESIPRMRELITKAVGEDVEIFEVVSVNITKRNGDEVRAHGREALAERVFDLLLEDIAHKVACDYAQALRSAWIEAAGLGFKEMSELLNKALSVKNMLRFVMNSDEFDTETDMLMDQSFDQLEKNVDEAEMKTNQRFNQILQPMSEFYYSYRGALTGSIVDEVQLDLNDWDTSAGDALEVLAKKFSSENLFPRLVEAGIVDPNVAMYADLWPPLSPRWIWRALRTMVGVG